MDALVEQARRECVELLRDPELEFDDFTGVAWFAASCVTPDVQEQEQIVEALWALPTDDDLDVPDGAAAAPRLVMSHAPVTPVIVARRTRTRSRSRRAAVQRTTAVRRGDSGDRPRPSADPDRVAAEAAR